MPKKKKKQKHIERICANCKLFNPDSNTCSIVVLHEGQRHRLPVDAEDECFFEGMYFDPTTKAMEDFAGDIKEVKFWVENEAGEKTNGKGAVKMEFPEGFFGKGTDALFDLPLLDQRDFFAELDEFYRRKGDVN
jgi:hypothetical protein